MPSKITLGQCTFSVLFVEPPCSLTPLLIYLIHHLRPYSNPGQRLTEQHYRHLDQLTSHPDAMWNLYKQVSYWIMLGVLLGQDVRYWGQQRLVPTETNPRSSAVPQCHRSSTVPQCRRQSRTVVTTKLRGRRTGIGYQ